MKRFSVSCMAAIRIGLSASLASGETTPTRGQVDPRIRTATYNADEVYKLYGFVGYAIELIFEDGELFSGTGGGDLEGVTIDAHGNSVLIKPRAAVVATNLVVFTDRRAYRFDYTALERAPNRATDEVMYAVRFVYPPPPTVNGEDPQTLIERELAAHPRSGRGTRTTGTAAMRRCARSPPPTMACRRGSRSATVRRFPRSSCAMRTARNRCSISRWTRATS